MDWAAPGGEDFALAWETGAETNLGVAIAVVSEAGNGDRRDNQPAE